VPAQDAGSGEQGTEVVQEPEPVTQPQTVENPGGPSGRENATARSQRTVSVPYAPDQWLLLQGAFPISESEWESALAALNALKVGLVAPGD